jgi:hypothetical protein
VRTIVTSRVTAVSLALLVTAGLSACSVTRTPSAGAPGNGQTIHPAATAAASQPAAAPSPTPTGIQNLVISSAEKSDLTAAFVGYYGVSSSDLVTGGPLTGTVYYAYDPATNIYWALASFEPTYTAPQNFQNAYLSSEGNTGFRKDGSAPWRVQPIDVGSTFLCNELQFFPVAVLMAWSMPTTPAAGVTC